jgi:hypothetical protein
VKRFCFIIIGVTLVAFVLNGCKARQVVIAPKKIRHLSVGRVTKLVKENALNYKTLSVKKANLSVNNNGKSMSVRGYYKIRKDSVIQISGQKLTIPVGKMEIVPDSFRIVYYLDQENFLGSFDYISNMLGIEVDYNTIQSILTGQLFSFKQDSRDNNFRDFACQIENDLYKITSLRDRKFRKITRNEDKLVRYRNRKDENHLIKQDIYIDPDSFVVRKMIFDDMDFHRSLNFEFSHYEKINNQWFPSSIIAQYTGEKSIRISMDLSKISIDDDWNFNFSIPSKYKKRYLHAVQQTVISEQ